ncbi:MAG: Hsp20/alpha crystallin family protein [Acidobacteria bacterium]|nr:Hsp20/alpha crystallin family protein [Acidobacteriota bacterium]
MSRGKSDGRGARAYAIPLWPFAGCAPGGDDAAPGKWNQWRDYAALQERMNRLFDDAGRGHARTTGEGPGEMERADWTPASDVYETEDAFVIAVDLPGIERAALDVSIDDGRLTVRGTRAADEGAKFHRAGRPAGRFVSRFGPLPPTVDQRRIAADYKDGVLRLRLPKRVERAGGKVKIEIR